MGAKRIVLGVGGVATTDGGAGLVQALGARLADDAGRELPPGGAALAPAGLGRAVAAARPARVEFWLASDVDNPLLGARRGRGVRAAEGRVPTTTCGCSRPGWRGGRTWPRPRSRSGRAALARCDRRHAGWPSSRGAGAAGGLGFAALLFLGARMRPGIELLLELASFGERLDGARLVITGEGSLDAQTLRGKAPVGVARAAAAHTPPVPVVAVAGRCTLSPDELRAAGISAAYAVSDIEPDPVLRMANAGPLVERLAERIAADWLG